MACAARRIATRNAAARRVGAAQRAQRMHFIAGTLEAVAERRRAAPIHVQQQRHAAVRPLWRRGRHGPRQHPPQPRREQRARLLVCRADDALGGVAKAERQRDVHQPCRVRLQRVAHV
eukprot:1022615-Prymnesium_polylepis.1